MKWRIIILFSLLATLIGTIVWQQIFTDNAMQTLLQKTENLSEKLLAEDTTTVKQDAIEIVEYWEKKEIVISLFVDYRDIEQIGRQADYVLAYIESGDWELAHIECEQLKHVANIFYNMVRLDWQNVL